MHRRAVIRSDRKISVSPPNWSVKTRLRQGDGTMSSGPPGGGRDARTNVNARRRRPRTSSSPPACLCGDRSDLYPGFSRERWIMDNGHNSSDGVKSIAAKSIRPPRRRSDTSRRGATQGRRGQVEAASSDGLWVYITDAVKPTLTSFRDTPRCYQSSPAFLVNLRGISNLGQTLGAAPRIALASALLRNTPQTMRVTPVRLVLERLPTAAAQSRSKERCAAHG